MLLDTSKKKYKGQTKKFFSLSDIKIVKNVKSSLSDLLSIRIKVYRKKIIENTDSKHIHDVVSDVGQIEYQTGKNFCTKPLSNAVIKMTKEFFNESEKTQKTCDIDSNNKMSDENKGKKYILWRNFILENSNGEILPKSIEIETALNIGERERKSYRDMGVEEGIIIKVNNRVFKLNKNY